MPNPNDFSNVYPLIPSKIGRMPSLFVSHGVPNVILTENPYSDAIQAFGKSLGSHWKATVVVSAHWISPGPVQVMSTSQPRTLHDFRGFQDELYTLEYPAPGSPEIAQEVVACLERKRIPAALNSQQGLDHGAWIPLKLLRPQADLPVIEVSIPMASSPRELLQMGNAIASLRNQGVLLLGSGGAVHNLKKIRWDNRSSADGRGVAFDTWLKRNLVEANIEELLNFETKAPQLSFAHPTYEHLSPLFFSIGASLAGDQLQMVYEGFQYGSLSMTSFTLTQPSQSHSSTSRSAMS